MKFVRHIRLILVVLLLPVNLYAQVQECDRLAASPFDPQKQSPGLGYGQLNASLAVPACKRATEESPQTARLWFQYGRALEKANRLPDAIYAYQEAVKLKSGAAHNNIGELYRDGKGFQKDLNKAEEYFVLAANLNSPEGKSNLSTLQTQLKKVGTPTQASTPSTQSTQTNVPAGGSTSTSPSFDCRKATTTVEKLICTNPELSKLDVGLAEMYKEAVSKDRSIRDDQRAWNVEKNKCTDTDCLKTTYEDRISQLVNFIVRHDRAALNQGQTSASASNGVGAQSQASPVIDTSFTLVNSSAEPIFEFFISPIKSTGWDKDILGEAVLMPGFEQAFTAGNSRGCQFDLRVVYGNKGFEEKRNLNLCQLERIVFDGRASTASTAQANPASAPRPTPSNVSPAPPLASPKQPAQRYASMDQFIAPEICAKYADNPIAAEKQFKGKLIKIYGPIERIAVDAFGTPFILISGRPVPCSVRLNFPKNKVSTLEDLRRGEFITAVCKTTNKILTNIMTDECQLL